MQKQSLERSTRDHLWQHFNKPPSPETQTPLMIERGEGCYVFDVSGKRYLDGVAGQYAVHVGHGRREIAEAAANKPRSWASSRSGATRTRPPPSWRGESPAWRPAI